ncbi:hypothetical protein WG66_016661 [Moniliophthora roreri]|nr:hypothetical protein WG66_016661 [Moniliophthora roreri]
MMGPRSMDGSPSTKQLITRYESLHHTPYASERTASLLKRLPSPPTNKKDKSPVRQSLRNLMGLLSLKKANNRLKLDNSKRDCISVVTPFAEELFSIPIPVPLTHVESASSSDSGVVSTSLLYLSRSRYPSWTRCTATLEEFQIHLIWSITEGDPVYLYIPLEQCTDVRSLSLNQLGPQESALLPSRTDCNLEYKVFEIYYNDQSKETFAAASTRERAQWVSSIWDNVLAAQDSKSAYRQSLISPTHGYFDPITKSVLNVAKPLPEIIERNLSAPLEEPPNLTGGSATDFGDTTKSSPEPKPLLAASEIPDRQASPGRSLRSSESPSKSPSIVNLSNLSMVKQRLAQIERQHSHQTSLSLPSSPLSDVLGLERPALKRNDSCKTAGADSIVEAYRLSGQYSLPNSAPPNSTQRSDTSSSVYVAPQIKAIQDRLLRLADREQLDEKFLSLQLNVQNVSREVDGIIHAGNSNVTGTLEQIRNTISDVDEKVDQNSATLRSIENQLEDIRARLLSQSSISPPPLSASPIADAVKILEDLEILKTLLKTEISAVLRKVEDISSKNAQLLQKSEVSEGKRVDSEAQMAEILKLSKQEEEHHNVQAQQQADSVRYLNELNMWLEAFVNNGTSHIQGMSSNLNRLWDALGSGDNSDKNMLADIRQLVQETHVREQHAATLQETVNSISTHLNSSVGHFISPQVMADMMNQHRADHEGLLKMLTAELSEEIKGERLRFVEAMKEATAINVSRQVEEFKSELKREVQGMTQEVSRLYRERRDVENQITDLFAFYAKQKSGGGALPTAMPARSAPSSIDYLADPRHARSNQSRRGIGYQ